MASPTLNKQAPTASAVTSTASSLTAVSRSVVAVAAGLQLDVTDMPISSASVTAFPTSAYSQLMRDSDALVRGSTPTPISVPDLRRLREELSSLSRASNLRERQIHANTTAVSAWTAQRSGSGANPTSSSSGPASAGATGSNDAFSPAADSSAGTASPAAIVPPPAQSVVVAAPSQIQSQGTGLKQLPQRAGQQNPASSTISTAKPPQIQSPNIAAIMALKKPKHLASTASSPTLESPSTATAPTAAPLPAVAAGQLKRDSPRPQVPAPASTPQQPQLLPKKQAPPQQPPPLQAPEPDVTQVSGERKRKSEDEDLNSSQNAGSNTSLSGGLVYRKTEDGSVKIAISQNGKMKVKIAEGVTNGSSVVSGSAASAVSLPEVLTGNASPTLVVGGTSTGTKAASPAPSILPKSKSSSTFNKPHNKSKSAKNLEKNKPRNKKKGAGSSATDRLMSLNQDDGETLSEADLAIKRGDYSNAKAPPNQIPFTQFFTFVDSQYFRPLTDEDFAFLDASPDDITPFIIPRLGRHYTEQWDAEERSLPPPSTPQQEYGLYSLGTPMLSMGSATGAIATPRGYEQIDDTVYGGDLFIGPLAERLLATLGEEGVEYLGADELGICRSGEGGGGVGVGNGEDLVVPTVGGAGIVSSAAGGDAIVVAPCRTTTDVMMLDERLKNELRFLGIIGEDETDGKETENDEICKELRMLQSELREQVAENTKRKQIIKELASYHRGWEQYNGVLDAISKQIESDYLKRFVDFCLQNLLFPPAHSEQRQNPNKKKKPSKLVPSVSAGMTGNKIHGGIHDSTMDNIRKRRMLMESIGVLFPYERVTIPSESVYPQTSTGEGGCGTDGVGGASASIDGADGTAAAGTSATPMDVD
ncbi:Transcriptional regulator [Entophlyctis luteolus]|nr:Transcriptional regulator [Entophlyctis luteolus]